MKDQQWHVKLVLAAGVLFSALTMQDYLAQWVDTGSFLGRYSPRLGIILGLVLISGLVASVGLVLSGTSVWQSLEKRAERVTVWLARLGWLLPLIGAALWLALPVLFLITPWNTLLFNSLYARLWAMWLLSLPQVLIWRGWRPAWRPLAIYCGSLLVFGLIVLVFNYRNDLSSSPFSLAWSEGSRFYNASLWDSRQIYGSWLPLPELHPTRYLLQSLAFLVPGASIAFHRVWQVFLWVFCNGLAAWALARRLKVQARATLKMAALFGLWAFLFFFLGPIYYHLIVCMAVVVWGFDRAHFWRSLGVVVLASVWAGLSRINWFPVPGLLAVMLYLLEEPLRQQTWWRYLLRPAAWTAAGLVAAFLTNAAYIRFSGNPPEVFGSALNSPLLWYRLLPNATFGPGVLLASLLLLPVILAALWSVVGTRRRWHWLRLLGLLAILGAFFGGGLLVSIKVGGGSNLHNLDSFIAFLAVIAGYGFFHLFIPDEDAGAPAPFPAWVVLINVALVVIVAASLLNLPARPEPKMSNAQALQWLQGLIDQYAQDGRPVLMVTERQLLSFNQLKVKSFEPSYEKVFLMEMAMSGNPDYLAKYVADIKQRKFSLIITEPMSFRIQQEWQFSEENNLWVQRIEEPTAGRYKLIGKLDEYPIAVYAPIPPQQP